MRPARPSSSGLLAATAFGGFQQADIHDAGLSVVMVADGDRAKARAACQAILDIAWRHKEEFIYRGEPLEQAIARAKQMAETRRRAGAAARPRRQLRLGRQPGHHVRPQGGAAPGVDRHRGRPGARSAGGREDDRGRRRREGHAASRRQDGHAGDRPPRASRSSSPASCAPSPTASTPSPARSSRACAATWAAAPCWTPGPREIVVIERNQEPWDRGVFTSVGIDPTAGEFLLLKSRMYFRPVFLPIAKGMVFCDAPAWARRIGRCSSTASCAGRSIRWTSFRPRIAESTRNPIPQRRKGREGRKDRPELVQSIWTRISTQSRARRGSALT